MPDPIPAVSRSWLPLSLHFQPLRVLLRFLVVLSILATLSWMDWQVDFPVLAAIALRLALLFGGAWGSMQLMKLRGIAPSQRWEHRCISMLILFLLFAPDVVWWAFPIIGAATEVLQRLVRLPSGPLINPAVFGGLVTALVLQNWNVIPTWWGVSFAPRVFVVSEGLSVATLLTLPIAGWIAWKYKKLSATFALIALSAVTYALAFNFNPAFLIFEGTLLFFALVMAVEPKTSPVLLKEQVIFGAVIGILIVVFQKIYFVEPYLGALAIANLGYNGQRWWKLRQARARANASKVVPPRVTKPGGTTSPLPAKG